MRRVIIESPYAGDVEQNTLYLRRALQHSLALNEAPFASHRMYTDALDDSIPEHRQAGIAAGYAWFKVAEAVIFYEDYGFSDGMKQALINVCKVGKGYTVSIEFRKIGLNDAQDLSETLQEPRDERVPDPGEQPLGAEPGVGGSQQLQAGPVCAHFRPLTGHCSECAVEFPDLTKRLIVATVEPR